MAELLSYNTCEVIECLKYIYDRIKQEHYHISWDKGKSNQELSQSHWYNFHTEDDAYGKSSEILRNDCKATAQNKNKSKPS